MVLDGPEFFLVASVSVQGITLNVFSIRYVCYADFSSLSMYFPFVTFVTLISTWTRKNPVLSFHIVNVEKDDLSLIFPSLRLLRLIRGKRWPRIFSCYLCFFGSHHSQCIFHSLLSLR